VGLLPGLVLAFAVPGKGGEDARIEYARQRLADVPAAAQVTLRVDPSLGHPEGFSIQSGRAAATIRGGGPAGVLYGVQEWMPALVDRKTMSIAEYADRMAGGEKVAGRMTPDRVADLLAEIGPLLRHSIVGPVLPLAEIQRFCEARVPRVGTYSSTAEWEAAAKGLRQGVLDRVVFHGQAAAWRKTPGRVEWLETIPGGPGYRIKKLRYEALPGMFIPALLYEPEKLAGRVPVVMNVNGHVGQPGKAVPYKQVRCINLAKRGMLALNVEWIGMGQLDAPGFQHGCMNQLDLCGTSGLAPFYLALERGLDVLGSLDHADSSRVAVAGLSGGGWQTILIGALDPRVALANPVAGYSSARTRTLHLKDLGDSEQAPCDLATLADYTHLTAMRAPRPTLLTYNAKDDCCFESGYALEPLTSAARPIFRLYHKESSLREHVNQEPGTHNFDLDNRQAFYRMVGDFFYPGDKGFDPQEIPSDKEVKSFEELKVPLGRNEDFNTLARALARDLPRDAVLPVEPDRAKAWRRERRAALGRLVRAADYPLQAIEAGSQTRGDLNATFWKFPLGGAWTVPAVELSRGEPKQTAIFTADGGRGSASSEVLRLLAGGYRVLAVDPLNLGESALDQPSFRERFLLLVASVGERPLGIQASQLAAIARWARERYKEPLALVSSGPRSSIAALVAASLEERAIDEVQLQGSLGSLKEILEANWTYAQAPELFCFGLLERFDVKQLAALVAPRPVKFLLSIGPGSGRRTAR